MARLERLFSGAFVARPLLPGFGEPQHFPLRTELSPNRGKISSHRHIGFDDRLGNHWAKLS